MKKATEQNSIWLSEVPGPGFGRLDRDVRVDVAIIGGGITGLTAGHQLKKAGLKVAVLEQHLVAGGETGHTTAHLTVAFDTGLEGLVESVGLGGARTVWDAGRRAIEHIEETMRMEQIDCHFRRVPGYLYAARVQDEPRVKREVELAKELGYGAELAHDPGFPPMRHQAMMLPSQAQFNPRLYLIPLAKLIQGDGSCVFEHTHVTKVHPGSPAMVEASGYTVTADYVIYATHQPIQDRFFASKVAAYQTYALGVKVPEGTFPYILAWDTQDPYHYWRQEPGAGYDLVIIGGEDHRTGQEDDTEARYSALESYVRTALHGTKYELLYRWSGQVLSPMDGLPFIGELDGEGHNYVATGYSGNGMTMGTFAALMITDLILGREHPATALFDPNRFRVMAGGVTFIEENLAYPTYLALDTLKPAERAELDDIKPGEGRVISLDGERVAASREPNGRIHAVSATCTHMGCQVHWNDAERTWDCPCHGSRFMLDGKVMNGPATEGLPPARACSRAETRAIARRRKRC